MPEKAYELYHSFKCHDVLDTPHDVLIALVCSKIELGCIPIHKLLVLRYFHSWKQFVITINTSISAANGICFPCRLVFRV